MANPDLSALDAYSGDYSTDLIGEMYDALKLLAEGITVVPNVKSKKTMHKLLVAKGAKPFTGKFVSKDGDIKFKPRKLEVEKVQRDLEIMPDKYRDTWMEQMRGPGEDSKNYNIPFAEFMWNAVLQELAQEINLETLYHGQGVDEFDAWDGGTAYAVGDLVTFTQDSELRYWICVTATAAGQSPTTHAAKWEWAGGRAIAPGFGKIIADEVLAGNLTEVATGPIDATNAYDQFTAMFRKHTPVVRKGVYGKVFTYCAMDGYESLMDNYEDKVKKNFEEVDGITYLPKTDRVNIIKPVSWLNGSGRLITTLNGNLQAGTDLLSDMNVINNILTHYTIQSSISFMFGTQIKDLAAIRVNDQK